MLRVTSARLTRQLERPVGTLSRIGERTLFCGKAIVGAAAAAAHYRREIVGLIAEISMGAGTLALIGAEADLSGQLEVGIDYR
jgi:phospholipid/cholesterol/gamma-HCH transport system permease protein